MDQKYFLFFYLFFDTFSNQALLFYLGWNIQNGKKNNYNKFYINTKVAGKPNLS